MIQIGYLKDLIATIGFLISIILIVITKDLNKYKNLIIYLLSACFLVDAIFSLNIKYHCLKFGLNIPTYSFIFGSTFAVLVFIHYLIKG
tara:strand:+ start:692 stop:958 length:267 start_codon:yes stop_codon:yes gene_type:complete